MIIIPSQTSACWLSLQVAPRYICADGKTSTTVTAAIKRLDGEPLGGHTVSFSIESGEGSLSSETATTDGSGQALTTYSQPTTPTPAIVTIKAEITINVNGVNITFTGYGYVYILGVEKIDIWDGDRRYSADGFLEVVGGQNINGLATLDPNVTPPADTECPEWIMKGDKKYGKQVVYTVTAPSLGGSIIKPLNTKSVYVIYCEDLFKTVNVYSTLENTIKINTGTFKKFQDILTNVANALKGDKKSIKVKPISGSLTWYKVEQENSNLAQTTYEFSASPGGFGYGDKFYIPSLSVNFHWVKVGIFVEPDLSLTITGIEIVRDGTKNPVEFTKLSGGAGLEGSISGGAGAEFNVKKVISVEADLKGTASAGGDFKVSLPGPKLSGTYTIGKITVSGNVVIEYRDEPILKADVAQLIWKGITDTAEVDLSSFFEK